MQGQYPLYNLELQPSVDSMTCLIETRPRAWQCPGEMVFSQNHIRQLQQHLQLQHTNIVTFTHQQKLAQLFPRYTLSCWHTTRLSTRLIPGLPIAQQLQCTGIVAGWTKCRSNMTAMICRTNRILKHLQIASQQLIGMGEQQNNKARHACRNSKDSFHAIMAWTRR